MSSNINAQSIKALYSALSGKKMIESPLAIMQWMGMKSNYPAKSIPANSFQYLLNMDFVSQYEVISRMGTSVFMDNSVTGSTNSIVGAKNFHVKGDATSKLVFATSDGKLYWLDPVNGGTPTFIGNITNSVTLKRVNMAVMQNKLYIADGIAGWEYNPVGPTLTQLTLPVTGGSHVIDVCANNSRLWWISDGDDIIASVVNVPTNTNTSNGAWIASLAENDGLSLNYIFPWGNTLCFVKYNDVTRDTTMYKLSGTDETNFDVLPLFGDQENPVGFLGRSAVTIGADVMGLTHNGFSTITAIQSFQETSLDITSKDIDDVIRRISWDYSYKISAIYDLETRQYFCAAPIDSASMSNIVMIYDPLGQRWGLYDNWNVCTFFHIKGKVYFGTDDGRIIKTRDGHNDLGAGFSKIVWPANWNFDEPASLKYFKSIDMDFTQAGDYTVSMVPIINGQDLLAKTVKISVSGNSEWDVAVWDVDPWDTAIDTSRTANLNLRGQSLSVRFENSNPDEPYGIRTMTVRSYKTDAGNVNKS